MEYQVQCFDTTPLYYWSIAFTFYWLQNNARDMSTVVCIVHNPTRRNFLEIPNIPYIKRSLKHFMIAPSFVFKRRRKTMARQGRLLQRQVTSNLFGIIATLVVTVGWFAGFRVSYQPSAVVAYKPRLRGRVWVTLDAQPFDQDEVASRAKHLVVVAGHSVVVSGNLEDAGTDESVWWLLDYQRGRGRPQACVGHIRAGIHEAIIDPQSLLVFSGGQTRPLTGPLSEGMSYFEVADALKLWPKGTTVRARTVAEEFATDSFENL